MKTKLKRLLSVFLCVAMLTGVMSSTALAAPKTSGKCGKNLKWSYDKSSNTLIISGKGAMNNYSHGNAPWQDAIGEYSESGVTIIINKGVTTIGNHAFTEIGEIKKIKFPSTLKRIGNDLFGGMGTSFNCSSITIPKSVTEIGKDNVFSGLKSIKVESGNKKFTSVDGILFNKKKTTLIACPEEKTGSFTIPKSTKEIKNLAFDGCNLKKLVVPKSVKKVGSSTFYFSNIGSLYFAGKPPKGLDFDWGVTDVDVIYYPKKEKSSWVKVIKKSRLDGYVPKTKTWNP